MTNKPKLTKAQRRGLEILKEAERYATYPQLSNQTQRTHGWYYINRAVAQVLAKRGLAKLGVSVAWLTDAGREALK